MPLGSAELLALTGMMGAGKSTVAARLGQLLSRPVVSTDALVVARAGKTIAELFRDDGEPAFRALEREAVASLRGALVADLGGGAFCDPASAAHLLRAGRVVYLEVSAAEAARRIGGGSGRPLAAEWEARLAVRRACYARAHLTVRVDGLAPEAVARKIVEAL
jgi:shikimate kinase